MSRVTIYRFSLYDIQADGMHRSRRWATREAIDSVHGEVLEETATEVDAAVVNTGIQGMTERGFDPHRRTGFQRVVTI
ncbi:MAG TPA: hypothetical protein VJ476_15495 [Rhizomicrobium sp.]|nr:hypothetical protein [Rhizomicrobium sp.]